jgi:hypothetical protein
MRRGITELMSGGHCYISTWDGHSKRKGNIRGMAWIQAVLARSNHDIVDSVFTLLSQIRLDAQIWGRRTKSRRNPAVARRGSWRDAKEIRMKG